MKGKNENLGKQGGNDSNTITIKIDKRELCRAMCNSSGEVGSEYCDVCKAAPCKKKASGKGSEYCDLCKAAPCKNKAPDNGESSSTGSSQDKGSEYCTVCKTEPCKRKDGSSSLSDSGSKYCEICESEQCNADDSDGGKLSPTDKDTGLDRGDEAADGGKSRSNDKATSLDRGDTYCNVCKSETCKQEERLSKNRNDSGKDGKLLNTKITSVDKLKNVLTNDSEYCASCNSSKCKYGSSKKERNASTSIISKNVNSTSQSITPKISDKITITVDKSEICGSCNDKNSTQIEDGSGYCNICNTEKCKLVSSSKNK